MKKLSRTLALFLVSLSTIAATAGSVLVASESLTVATAPPVVVETFPRAGETAVDPTIGEIRVLFSKDMMTEQMWSVVKASEDTFPELTGEVHFVDSRTFVMPVRLEPGKSYAMWFNNKKAYAFRDESNQPAVPYFLVFETRR